MGVKTRKGGKPQRFTVDEIECAMENALGNISLAAAMLKCERKTVYSYISRFPGRLAGLRQKFRAEIADIAEGHLLVALRRGEVWAVLHVLRLYGRYIGLAERVDITAPVAIPKVEFKIEFVRSHFKKDDGEIEDEIQRRDRIMRGLSS